MFYFTYVLKSDKDNKYYIGWSNDLRSRVKLHTTGKINSTKFRLPLKLVYYEACLNKENAIAREKSLKTDFGRAYLRKRLKR